MSWSVKLVLVAYVNFPLASKLKESDRLVGSPLINNDTWTLLLPLLLSDTTSGEENVTPWLTAAASANASAETSAVVAVEPVAPVAPEEPLTPLAPEEP